jgi:alpha-glucosidase
MLVPWQAPQIAALIAAYEAALQPTHWPNWVLGNHDQHRLASRLGPAQARIAAMLLLTLRGTPTLYYGDELGMCDVEIPPQLVRDPWELNVPGLGLGRDPERTPMQWDGSRQAGFTTGIPWLPLAADAQRVNVAVQRQDEGSLLALYHRLLHLRRTAPALAVGAYMPFEAHTEVLAYTRTAAGQRFLVALNLGRHPQQLAASQAAIHGKVMLSTHLDRHDEAVHGTLALRGDEGVIVRIE